MHLYLLILLITLLNLILIKSIDKIKLDNSKVSDIYYKSEPSGITWGEFIEIPNQLTNNKYNKYNINSIQNQWINQLITCNNQSMNVLDKNKTNCNQDINYNYINDWKSKFTNDYCENNAASKIECFDSLDNNRYCVFYNAMISLKKMKPRVQSDGSNQRLWERGFISADCGHSSKDDINYFSIYKPDISGSHDAICDYTFNQTTLLYSHDNIMNFGHTMNDILNVWTLLNLQNLHYDKQGLNFFNVDGIRKGKVYDDNLYQFYGHYKILFNDIMRLSDYSKQSRLCFKTLIMPSKPILTYLGRSNKPFCDERSNQSSYTHDLIHTWNLHYRYYNQLIVNNDNIEICFIVSSMKSNVIPIVNYIYNTKSYLQSNYQSLHIKLVNITSISLSQQIRAISTSSIIIGLHGSGLNALSTHMSIGSKYCCGIIEINYIDNNDIDSYHHNNIHVGQLMSFYYNLINVNNNDLNNKLDKKFTNVIVNMAKSIESKPTCISKNAIYQFK